MYDKAENKTRVGNSWSGSRPTSQSCFSPLSAVLSAPGAAQRPQLAIQPAACSFPYCPWHPQASLLLLLFSASPPLLSWFPPHFSVIQDLQHFTWCSHKDLTTLGEVFTKECSTSQFPLYFSKPYRSRSFRSFPIKRQVTYKNR